MVLRLFHQAALAFVSLMVVFYQHFFFFNHPRAPELMSLNGWVNMEFYLLLIGFFFSSSTKCIKRNGPIWRLLHHIIYAEVERYLGGVE